MRINLGCGNDPRVGYINHDRTEHSPHVDIAWDLEEIPWPWEDGAADCILAKAVFEHLRWSLIESVNESWRILEPGGRLFIKLPAWNSHVSYQDPTHRWFFDPRVFEYFDPKLPLGKIYSFYTPFKWNLIGPAKYNSKRTSFNGTLEKICEPDLT